MEKVGQSCSWTNGSGIRWNWPVIDETKKDVSALPPGGVSPYDTPVRTEKSKVSIFFVRYIIMGSNSS